MISNSFNVLLIGCGNMAAGFDLSHETEMPRTHASGYAKHGGFNLAACVEPNVDRRIETAKKWNIPLQFENTNQIDEYKYAFDVISICSPTNLHLEHIKKAISLKPKVIFCEKPLTTSLHESKKMIDLCNSNNISLAVNYSRYWDPSVNELAELIKQNYWGEIRSVVAHYNKGILNNGGHMIGLLQQLLGELKIISARNVYNDLCEDDLTVLALLNSIDGIPIYLNPTHASDYSYFELEIFFSRAVIRMLNGGLSWQTQTPICHEQFTGYKKLSAPKVIDGKYSLSMSLAIDNIYEHLANSQTLVCTGESALIIQKMCESIKKTAAHTNV